MDPHAARASRACCPPEGAARPSGGYRMWAPTLRTLCVLAAPRGGCPAFGRPGGRATIGCGPPRCARFACLLPPEGAARPSGGRAAGRLFLRGVVAAHTRQDSPAAQKCSGRQIKKCQASVATPRMRAACSATTQQDVYAQSRPPARPVWAGDANLSPIPRPGSVSILDNGSPARVVHTWRAPSMRPREFEGSRRRTRMTKGKSGARAPDRNRWRAPRVNHPRRAAYEATPPNHHSKAAPRRAQRPHLPHRYRENHSSIRFQPSLAASA